MLVVSLLQRGHVSPSPVDMLQRGQNIVGCVNSPHSHLVLNVVLLQLWHFLTPNSTSISPILSLSDFEWFAASWSDRILPPAWPIGNKTCTEGRISRLFDFSGRPILPPILNGARSIICTPLSIETAFTVVFASSGDGCNLFSSGVRPRHLMSGYGCSIIILPSRTLCGINSVSRSSFIFASWGIVRAPSCLPFSEI